jgi:uncharacterized protein (TIGR03435 family)
MDLPATVAQFAHGLWVPGNRRMIDRTGIRGKFDFHLEYATGEANPSDDARCRPSFPSLCSAGG